MAKIEHILDGAVALYQRLDMGTQTWTARYKIRGMKGHVSKSTGKRDLEEAKEFAREKYHELSADHRRGIAIHSHTFQRAVDAYLEDLDASIALRKTTARTKRDNKAVIDRYLLPYFKTKAIDAIKQEHVEAYKAWRLNYWTTGPGVEDTTREYMRGGKLIKSKRPAMGQTQRSGEILVLRAIFKSARKRGWVKREQIPEIEEEKREEKRRPAFSASEWKRILAAMPIYIKSANGPVSEHDRKLLCAYMQFMFETGLRPGKEHQQLTWADCELVKQKAEVGHVGITHIHVRNDTKTGKLNQLCEHPGGARYDDILINCIANFSKRGKISPDQGNWLVRQIDMHCENPVQHSGEIRLTKEQRRPIKQAVKFTNSNAQSSCMAYLHNRFPHVFHTVSTPSPHQFHTKSANTSVQSMAYPPAIARLLLKLIDGPLALPDGFSANLLLDDGSLAARHHGERDGISPLGLNANVNDDAAPPLRGSAAKSDKPLDRREGQFEGNANSPMEGKANRSMRQVKANSTKANISLWVDGGSKSHVRGQLDVGNEKFRLNFRSPLGAEELAYVGKDGDPEARQWFEGLGSNVIPKLQATARAATGKLSRKHIASAIHEFGDRICEGNGVVCGFAFMVYRDDSPAHCMVMLGDMAWHFELKPGRSSNANSPQFKATAEPYVEAA